MWDEAPNKKRKILKLNSILYVKTIRYFDYRDDKIAREDTHPSGKTWNGS